MVEIGKEMIYLASPSSVVYKKKIILRSPRALYPKVELLAYPPLLDQLPQNYSIDGQEKEQNRAPLEGLACQDQATNFIF